MRSGPYELLSNSHEAISIVQTWSSRGYLYSSIMQEKVSFSLQNGVICENLNEVLLSAAYSRGERHSAVSGSFGSCTFQNALFGLIGFLFA